MNISITLSAKEAAQVHQILKAFDEGLIANPSEGRFKGNHKKDRKIASKRRE